ncbi:hypothetical protein BO71DRAFT_294547, partial [Aspergillus ellipticus CBS 707.79]
SEYNLYGPLAGPSAATETTWSESLPYLVDRIPIAPDLEPLPLFDENTQWLMNPISPAMPAWSGAAPYPARTASDPTSTLINPIQSLHSLNLSTNPAPDRKYSADAIYPLSQQQQQQQQQQQPPTAPRPTLQEITSRGSISSSSSSQSQFSSARSSSTRRSRSCSRSSQTATSSGFTEHVREQRKRERFLERNRVAANKCRKKKKEHAKQLESRCLVVSKENSTLETEVDHLRSEILTLKNELLRHSQCGDNGIKRHLAQMIKEISDKGAAGASESRTGGSPGPDWGPGLKVDPLEDEQKMDFDFDDLVRLPPVSAGD